MKGISKKGTSMKRPALYGDKSAEVARKKGNYIQERADKMKEPKGDPRDMMSKMPKPKKMKLKKKK